MILHRASDHVHCRTRLAAIEDQGLFFYQTEYVFQIYICVGSNSGLIANTMGLRKKLK
jgi:hypothetical protein